MDSITQPLVDLLWNDQYGRAILLDLAGEAESVKELAEVLEESLDLEERLNAMMQATPPLDFLTEILMQWASHLIDQIDYEALAEHLWSKR